MLLREVMVHEQSSMVRVVAAVTVMVWEPAVTTVAAGQKVVKLKITVSDDVLLGVYSLEASEELTG